MELEKISKDEFINELKLIEDSRKQINFFKHNKKDITKTQYEKKDLWIYYFLMFIKDKVTTFDKLEIKYDDNERCILKFESYNDEIWRLAVIIRNGISISDIVKDEMADLTGDIKSNISKLDYFTITVLMTYSFLFHRDSLEIKNYEFSFKERISKELISIINILIYLENLNTVNKNNELKK